MGGLPNDGRAEIDLIIATGKFPTLQRWRRRSLHLLSHWSALDDLNARAPRRSAQPPKRGSVSWRPAGVREEFLDAVRAATNGGWALGDARFKRQIAKALGRRV